MTDQQSAQRQQLEEQILALVRQRMQAHGSAKSELLQQIADLQAQLGALPAPAESE